MDRDRFENWAESSGWSILRETDIVASSFSEFIDKVITGEIKI